MKYLIFLTVVLTTLLACNSVPVVYEDGYNDGNDRYDDGFYRYDSRRRTARYDSYNRSRISRDAYGRNQTFKRYNRYDAYKRHGHALHSSRYRSFHHGHRRHLRHRRR